MGIIKLEKCIAINIVYFERIPLEKIHTSFHVLEDETGYKLTDVLEIHFLELPKLARLGSLKNTDDKVIDWLKFLDANSKEGLEMLAEIMDQLTRENTARKEGMEEERERVAKSLLDVLDDKTISAKTGLSVEFVKGLRK